MRKFYLKLNLALLLTLFFSVSSIAQNRQSIWTKVNKIEIVSSDLVYRKSTPQKAGFYQLDINNLRDQLRDAPLRHNNTTEFSNVIIDFPNADGSFESYRVLEAPILESELQDLVPNIRSYVGQSVENPSTIIRFSVTPQGLHTMTLSSGKGSQFIDPYTTDTNAYIVYSKKDLPFGNRNFECGVEDEGLQVENTDFDLEAARNANDGQMRNFRLALACTIEYSAFHWTAAGLTAGDTEATRKDAVLAAMVVTMTRVNGVYERELSITMTLVANNLDIIYILSDSFNNDNAGALIDQSQSIINSVIGATNYDIGHTFSTGGGGLAQLNSPCVNNSKARGITGLPNPVGDGYDIDFVSHEMGHQFGGPHTFNGNTANCAGNGSPSNAYEPGSGTTIMAYAGICTPQNVQGASDAYFHQKSLQMIWANVTGGNSQCASQTATGNSAPTADAGTSYTIPISTPYMLTASSTDADGVNTHTFTWEQWDLGPTGVPTETTPTGPLVRSYEGTENPTRFIPNIPDLIAEGGSTEWERLVSIGRAINFQVTVRDNDSRGGQTATDGMTVTTSTSSGPFAVTSQNTAVTWSGGNTETITWDVAGTSSGAVNAANVDILLSINGGMTFDTVLATAVTNNGSYDIVVPDVLEENCLIMVKGSGNIFFNINTARIAIGYNITAGEVCETFTFNLNQTLTTNAAAFEQFGVNVSGTGTITDVNFKYDISTSNIGQLHMAIISAGGTRAYAHNANGQCTSGANMQVIWDDEAAGTIVCDMDPTTGTALPSPGVGEPLNAIDGEEMNGAWVVMTANIGPTNMVFNFADIEICKNGFVTVLAPDRITQSTVEVDVMSSATVDDTHLVVSSPNTANAVNIEFTLTVLTTEGTLYLNGTPLALNDTFTQADINNNSVTYTTTSAVDAVDSFRVDVDDNNNGTLPNLLVNIQITDGLSVDDFDFDLFNVYPNPTNGEVTIQLSSYEDVNISLFDIQGRLVYANNFVNNTSFNKTVDFSSFSAGIYMLQVKSGLKTATKKLIIK